MQRWERIGVRYPGWRLVIPEAFRQQYQGEMTSFG
jgi:hypothetical protein